MAGPWPRGPCAARQADAGGGVGRCHGPYLLGAGLIQSTVQEVIDAPMKASALYVGMSYAEPLAFYEAMGARGDKLAQFQQALRACLSAAQTAATAAAF